MQLAVRGPRSVQRAARAMAPAATMLAFFQAAEHAGYSPVAVTRWLQEEGATMYSTVQNHMSQSMELFRDFFTTPVEQAPQPITRQRQMRVQQEEGPPRQRQRTEESLSNIQSTETNDQDMQQMRGDKRKHGEEHGMEPHGHGNTPATGTVQQNYVEKYVPRSFSDKTVLKLRWVNAYNVANIGTATTVTPSYFIWNTNSMVNVEPGASSHFTSMYPSNHHPSQFSNTWSLLYGYYRVECMDYTITVANTYQKLVTPSGGIPEENADLIVTLLPTQNANDITVTTVSATQYPTNQWEQKQSHNIYLQSRSPGATRTMHTFRGCINPEDFDIDPLTTASDETWTAVASNPSTARYLGITMINPTVYNTGTANLASGHSATVFVDFEFTVQFAGYKPALREATG